jgi:hypothetical protein
MPFLIIDSLSSRFCLGASFSCGKISALVSELFTCCGGDTFALAFETFAFFDETFALVFEFFA